MSYRPSDRFGLTRVISPKGVLPQQADQIDPNLPLAADEMRIEVESLNIDSASFHQISEVCSKDEAKIAAHILDLVTRRGKQHNPVTGSGGMLIGKVAELGPEFPVREKPVRVGDRIATLVSLSLTPLKISKIKKIHAKIDRVDIDGEAVLFSSGIFSKLPADMPETVALAVLDVAGAPAQTEKLVKENQVVVVIGGGGKSGLLCLHVAKKVKGVTTIAVDYSPASLQRVRSLGLADVVIQADARNAVEVMNKVAEATQGKMADVVINVANIPETEISSILSCRQKGIVYLFSMATSFTRAALGAEGVGADVDLRIGNGYTEGHANCALNIMRESEGLFSLFKELYG